MELSMQKRKKCATACHLCVQAACQGVETEPAHSNSMTGRVTRPTARGRVRPL